MWWKWKSLHDQQLQYKNPRQDPIWSASLTGKGKSPERVSSRKQTWLIHLPSQLPDPTTTSAKLHVPETPIEIVNEEKMAAIEASLAAASNYVHFSSSVFRSWHFNKNVRSIPSLNAFSKKRYSSIAEGNDLARGIRGFSDARDPQNRVRHANDDESFLNRFRKHRGLSVSDLISTEWCEKNMEFTLDFEGQAKSKAMRAGKARHQELEMEVQKKVKVRTSSAEDKWALKFLDFIAGAQQLVSEGLTREVPVVGYVEGVWMVGKIDEVRMSAGGDSSPVLVEMKTRSKESIPSEPQRRNGRFQTMCYKHLWDNIVTDKFPSEQFFDFFKLNPQSSLSNKIQEGAASCGYQGRTLDELVKSFRNMGSMLLPADDKLLLRYEFQQNQTLILEDYFAYDPVWLKSKLGRCLEFWQGERQASYAQEEERWKCQFCNFASDCPKNNGSSSTTI